ncbi:retrotransposon protein, putative, ty1-copia subclass [Tanacetum coccineum]
MVDYEETFSPVADIRAIRILISIAAFYDYEIWQMDVKTAFLNGYLDEDIYMVQPEGFVDPKHPRKVCKLQRSIYGLKQASKSWNKRFDEEIKKFGFDQNLDEPCVYQKASGSNVTFLILYVDDIIIMGNHIPSLQSVKNYLGKCFSMKDLGEAAFILGIKIYRDRSKRLIGLSQNAYMVRSLKSYKMDNFQTWVPFPMQERLDLNKSQGAQTPKEQWIGELLSNSPLPMSLQNVDYMSMCSEAAMKAVGSRQVLSQGLMALPVQNINHSAFRSIFEKEKLSSNNFNDWFARLKLVLRVEKKLYVIEQPLPPALEPVAEPDIVAQWTALYDAHTEIACLMLRSMTPELHRQFEFHYPYDMIQELRSMFEKQAGVEKFDLIQSFHACKQEEGKPVADYVLKMKGYVEKLERLGYVLPQDITVGLILNGLTKDFVGFVRNYNMHNMGKTVGEIHAMLIEYEKGLPKKAETPQVMMIKGGKTQKANKKSLNAKGQNKVKDKGKDKKVYIPKPKNPKPTTMERPAKDDACHHCIFIIELFYFPNNNSWVYDIGCGTHICITKHGFRIERKLKQGALYLYVGNGVRAQVEAIGSFDLVLPNGLVICLDNCHYAPTITRGVVSVSHLVDNGFVQCFTDYGILVLKNDVLYFNFVARNDDLPTELVKLLWPGGVKYEEMSAPKSYTRYIVVFSVFSHLDMDKELDIVEDLWDFIHVIAPMLKKNPQEIRENVMTKSYKHGWLMAVHAIIFKESDLRIRVDHGCVFVKGEANTLHGKKGH